MNTSIPLPAPFGRYRLLRKLGEGGMGAVYLAEDSQLGRRVALKVPHFGSQGDRTAVERFYREARVAAAIDHPNVCPVLDVGAVDGVHYLTMPFIDGQPLTAWLNADRPPASRRVAALVARLARALAVLHQKGLIHRDLKPANVMLRADGQPVVMDFGLARSVGGQDRLTRTGAAVGTPAYMSPEQVGDTSQTLGPGTDIYSLGVILYHLLTGQLPFPGPGPALFGQILYAEPQPPSGLRAGLPPELDALCLRALAKQPGQRYASMIEFAEALETYLRQSAPAGPGPVGKSVPNRPQPPTARPAPASATPELPPPRRLWPWLLATAGLGLLGLLVPVGIALWSRPAGTRIPGAEDERITNTLEMTLVRVPPGQFQMGAPDDEPGRTELEGPRRRVELSKPFYLGTQEVTVGQFRRFVVEDGYPMKRPGAEDGWGYNDREKVLEGPRPHFTWDNVGWPRTDRHPVVNVSHEDASAFCLWLGSKEGRRYRLPTEAEWEYACRAGTTTAFHTGAGAGSLRGSANVSDQALQASLEPGTTRDLAFQPWDDGHAFTAPVGSFKPNAWGLYDMHGNVWEWCHDWEGAYPAGPDRDPRGPAAGQKRVYRGGAFGFRPALCRCASRRAGQPGLRGVDVGFRVALEVTGPDR